MHPVSVFNHSCILLLLGHGDRFVFIVRLRVISRYFIFEVFGFVFDVFVNSGVVSSLDVLDGLLSLL